ncbi:MAG TPA: efflux RND transporter periplasmic adaptor subunit [Gemmatimonadaceae bacterium]|nr:efflux RND transporter periplasmic adaptor subunit [Gemmatimonadaceae bacterium]
MLAVGGVAVALILLTFFFAPGVVGRRNTSTASQNQPPSADAMDGMAMPGASSGGSASRSSSDGSVRLTSNELREFGVTFAPVELRTLSSELRAAGTVTIDETRVAKVTARFSGYAERLYANFAGQQVTRGQPVAEIFSPELLAAEQELLLASRMSRTMGTTSIPGVSAGSGDLVGAARQRLRFWGVSDSQINQVLRSGRPLRTVTLHAPVSGVIIEKKIVQGQAIQMGEELYTIADLSSVWVETQLREADGGAVAPGSAATIVFSADPGRTYSGRVAFVYPTLGAETRTVRARIVVANGDRRLRPGMYATVRITSGAGSALAVPRSAVVETGERTVVFVDMGGGELMPHAVRVGRSGGEYVEVLSGVAAGQRVVTSAQFLLDSEANLGDLMKGMAPTDGSMKGMDMSPAADPKSKGADMRGMPGMSSPTPRR